MEDKIRSMSLLKYGINQKTKKEDLFNKILQHLKTGIENMVGLAIYIEINK